MKEDVSSRAEWCEVKDLHGLTEITNADPAAHGAQSVPTPSE